MQNCIFCKIVRGEAPSYKIFEDDDFIGFLTIHPLSRGHSLVVPKKHYRWVWDSPDIGSYFTVVQKIVAATKKAFNTDFVIGVQVGDEVPHAHVALIPRYENDGHGSFLNTDSAKTFRPEEMEMIARSIHGNL